MLDLRETIEPKSDQLNADDLVSGPRVIRITKVAKTGAADQPTAIDYEGSNGKPYKPCKTMRRLIVEQWGYDGDEYIGRSIRLIRDPQVKWGGAEVGGLRITHLSDIPADTMTSVTVTRGKKVPYKVQKLDAGKTSGAKKSPPTVAQVVKAIAEAKNSAALIQVLERSNGYKWTDEEKEAIDKAADDMRNVFAEAVET